MPGTPHGVAEALAALSGADFETRFLELMLPHHEGAIQMANEAWQSSGDPRLRRLAHQIHHAQGAQIARMRRLGTCAQEAAIDGAAIVLADAISRR